MKYWPGLVMLAASLWLFHAALRKRRNVLAARRQAAAEGRTTAIQTHPQLLALAAALQPIVTFALLIVGAMIVGVYVTTDLARDFSVVDLAGFLGLLAGYGTWFLINTTYRDVAVISR